MEKGGKKTEKSLLIYSLYLSSYFEVATLAPTKNSKKE
jgi:hypothetical protein